jgi:hypothetical protein
MIISCDCDHLDDLDSHICKVVSNLVNEMRHLQAAFDELHAFVYGQHQFDTERN